MTITPLDAAPIGPPITRGGISIYPVYLPGNALPSIGTGRDSGLTIDELPDAEVPHLVVHNPTGQPILIVEGEQFVGGRQNRTANTSVLVPAGEARQIPVSCLEVGRWGRHRAFEHAPTFTPRRVRRTKQREVARTMAGISAPIGGHPGAPSGDRSGDQHQVWHAIQTEMNAMAAPSDTGAVADADQVLIRDQHRRDAVDELVARGPLPGQCGIVVAHGWRAVAAEVFGTRELLAAHWGPLVRSHLLEQPTATGQRSATGAMKLLRRFAQADSVDSPGLGMGTEHHVAAERVTGQALTLDGALVHAGIFRRG